MVVLILSGCASTITGSGNGRGAPYATPVAPSTQPPLTAPATTSPTTKPTPPPTSAAPSGGCSGSDAYCEDFSSGAAGWDTGTQPHFFSAYSKYQGGTFEMGERHNAVLTVPAPYDITKAAADDSVRVDLDMILAPTTPRRAIYGASCWNHETHGGETSAFVFYATKGGAQIVLWDDKDGTAHVLKNKAWTNVLRPAPYRNKMRVLCEQRRLNGHPVAELGMSVNGSLLTEIYSQSRKHHAWRTGDRVGLIVGLNKSDVYYDNFAVNSECKGSHC